MYAGAVDNNGYFPTHNKRYSQPLTGDYDIDLGNNRTKRIFSDRTGSRCGSNKAPFLLQTYKRDTGEFMHDISAPIHVKGFMKKEIEKLTEKDKQEKKDRIEAVKALKDNLQEVIKELNR